MKSTGRRTKNNNDTDLGRQEFEEDRFLHLVKHSDYGGDHGTATTTTIYYNETTTFNSNATASKPQLHYHSSGTTAL